MVKNAESIHLPYLIAVFSAISIGFAEPNKGLVAGVRNAMRFAPRRLFSSSPLYLDNENSAEQELENFSLYGAMILTLAASFLGGFLREGL